MIKCKNCEEPAVVDISWFDREKLMGGSYCRQHANKVWRSMGNRGQDTAMIEVLHERETA